MKKTSKDNKEAGGIAFVGFLFLGMAIGALFNRWDVGPFLGLGLGFVVMAAIKLKS